MAQAEVHKVFEVAKNRLFDVITQYEDYPRFLSNVRKVSVERLGEQKSLVTYQISLIKEVSYTLRLTENRESGRVEWVLAQSDYFKKNSGLWELREVGKSRTDVLYTLDLEFKIPVPKLILSRLVKANLPTMVDNFVSRAQET